MKIFPSIIKATKNIYVKFQSFGKRTQIIVVALLFFTIILLPAVVGSGLNRSYQGREPVNNEVEIPGYSYTSIDIVEAVSGILESREHPSTTDQSNESIVSNDELYYPNSILAGAVERNRKIPVSFLVAKDGDTFVFSYSNRGITEEFTARALCIDTPESVKRDSPIMPFALSASDRSKQLLSTAEKIFIEFDYGNNTTGEITDTYGRYLCYIFIDDQLLQEVLLEEGLAILSYVGKNTNYISQLEQAVLNAKNKSLRVWSIEDYVQESQFGQYDYVFNEIEAIGTEQR